MILWLLASTTLIDDKLVAQALGDCPWTQIKILKDIQAFHSGLLLPPIADACHFFLTEPNDNFFLELQ